MQLFGKILFATGIALLLLCIVARVARAGFQGTHTPSALTARNGREQDGRYFVGGHGRYVEVSGSEYQFLLWQEYGAMTGVCLLISGVWFLELHKKRMERQIAPPAINPKALKTSLR